MRFKCVTICKIIKIVPGASIKEDRKLYMLCDYTLFKNEIEYNLKS